MTKRHSSNRAILILESPWELDYSDSNRTSVLPFVEGVGKLAGDTEVYHANFYDKSSFLKALDCLCKRKFTNTTVYIAAHGYKKKVGNVSISDLIWEVGLRSKECNITGLMIGSCFVGENTSTMEAYLEGTNLKWCAGYSSTSLWLEGTLIDCAILSRMTDLDETDYADKDNMIHHFASSIAAFSDSFKIGRDYREQPVPLNKSLQFVIQPSGKGKRAKCVSEEVFEVRASLQL
ncbi:hypothetical protein Q7I30_19105 [Aeromonas veronii]|uniref:hypothetical protein n=1 Tax=Aeromonas veronii TaxID=654 RepID=UPI00143196EA|nr:hypothetical protein [Aeromonas veronii]MBL0451929.1 hypothetical protein [Aeromonas veronii]MCF5871850.1 hypothetical protein [Aeromonas veronii]NJI20638.1 hypothetical protein [Aeromonas veronii]HDO1355479.1 hypothetical protein [Aeromonas veronii]